MNKIELGCAAKDKITGLSGIVIAMTYWMDGCVRITIQPQELREGKPIESQTFDVEQVEYVGEGIKAVSKPSGGDRRSIGRRTRND